MTNLPHIRIQIVSSFENDYQNLVAWIVQTLTQGYLVKYIFSILKFDTCGKEFLETLSTNRSFYLEICLTKYIWLETTIDLAWTFIIERNDHYYAEIVLSTSGLVLVKEKFPGVVFEWRQ